MVKSWEELEIRDDYMFAKVMRDKKICKTLLEKLLHIKVKDLEYVEAQKTINISYDAKSVRLDVYVEDEDRIFDVEMQTTNQKGLAKRSRYYQSMLDLNTIEKGETYRKLKESYVIFICTFDPFGLGRAQYCFENFCVEERSLKLGDGTQKIFFNTKDYMQSEDAGIQAFLRYVNGETGEDAFVQELDAKVKQVKENKEWRAEYMTLLMREQEIREEAMAKGLEKGLAKGMEKGMAKGMEKGLEKGKTEMILAMLEENADVSFIATVSKFSEEEILKLKEEHRI